MSLPNIPVVGKNEASKRFLEEVFGNNAPLIKLTTGIKTYDPRKSNNIYVGHSLDGGKVKRMEYCAKCGEPFLENKKSCFVDIDGVIYKLDDKNSLTEGKKPIFEVLWTIDTLEIDYKWVGKTYFVESNTNEHSLAILTSVLKTKALAGYLRVRKGSLEKPAVLWSPEKMVLVLQTLHYYETEASVAIPGHTEIKVPSSVTDALYEIPTTSVGEIEHREAIEYQKMMLEIMRKIGDENHGDSQEIKHHYYEKDKGEIQQS